MHATTLFAAAAHGRHDLYGLAHKGMRRAHSHLLAHLGAADFRDEQVTLLASLRDHLALVERRLRDEEAHVHPAVASADPDCTVSIEREHAGLRATAAMLEIMIRAVEGAASTTMAIANGRQLYLMFSRFVAADLWHMADEESRFWPLLCERLDDGQLAAIHCAITSDRDPATRTTFAINGLLAAPASERMQWLGMVQAAGIDVLDSTNGPALIAALHDDERRQLDELCLTGDGDGAAATDR